MADITLAGTQIPTLYKLLQPSDFPFWWALLRHAANLRGVWEYIDPDGPEYDPRKYDNPPTADTIKKAQEEIMEKRIEIWVKKQAEIDAHNAKVRLHEAGLQRLTPSSTPSTTSTSETSGDSRPLTKLPDAPLPEPIKDDELQLLLERAQKDYDKAAAKWESGKAAIIEICDWVQFTVHRDIYCPVVLECNSKNIKTLQGHLKVLRSHVQPLVPASMTGAALQSRLRQRQSRALGRRR